MLLTITTTHKPATDLGYLLHKSPLRIHSFEQVFGKTHVFYPETTPERCTAALLLEIDPVGLVRDRRGPSGEGYLLEQYVNDRPYAASSFLSVAIARTFGTAISGKSNFRLRNATHVGSQGGKHIDLAAIDVEPRNSEALFDEQQRQRKSDVSQTDDADSGGSRLKLCNRFLFQCSTA